MIRHFYIFNTQFSSCTAVYLSILELLNNYWYLLSNFKQLILPTDNYCLMKILHAHVCNWSKAVNLFVVLRFLVYKKFWLWLAFWFLILRYDLDFNNDDPHFWMVMQQLKDLYLPSEYRNEIWLIILKPLDWHWHY